MNEYGKIATSPEEQAANRARLQESLSSLGTQSQIVGGNVVPIPPIRPEVSAEQVGSIQPISVPATSTPTAGSALSSDIQGIIADTRQKQTLQQQQDAEMLKMQEVKAKSQADVLKLQERVLGVVEGRAEAEREAGIEQKAQRATDYTNQLEALERAEINALRRLDQNFQGSPQGKIDAMTKIQRDYAFQKADVALLQSAANRDLQTAMAVIDRRIQLELEPLKLRLDFAQQFYAENKEDFTKAEDRAFQLRVQNEQREYDERLNDKNQIRSIQLQSAMLGASPTLLSQLGNANTFEQALQIAGKTLGQEFTLKLRQQALAEQLAENEALTKADEMNLKVGTAFVQDDRVQQFQTTDQAYVRLNAIAPDREDATFEEMSGNNAAERALITQYIRMTQPDIARAADGDNITATNKFTEIVESAYNAYLKDKRTPARKLKEIAVEADKLYQASVNGLNSATTDFENRLQSGIILPSVQTYKQVTGTSVAERITLAESNGWSQTAIVDYLRNDPIIGTQIETAEKRWGYATLDIINFLKTLSI